MPDFDPCNLCGEVSEYPVELTEHDGQAEVTWDGRPQVVATFSVTKFCGRMCLQAWLNLERLEGATNA